MTSLIALTTSRGAADRRRERTDPGRKRRTFASALSHAIGLVGQDPRTRYLSAAVDAADLERRTHRWDEHETGRLSRLALTL